MHAVEDSGWEQWLDLALRGEAASRRASAVPAPAVGAHPQVAADLLGLLTHPSVVAAAASALTTFGPGVVTGPALELVPALKAELARWSGCEDVLLLPSGAAAREAVLAAVAGKGTTAFVGAADPGQYRRVAPRDLRLETFSTGDAATLEDHMRRTRAAVFVETVSFLTGRREVSPSLADACERASALLVLDDTFALFDGPPSTAGAAVLRIRSLLPLLGVPLGMVAGPADWVRLVQLRRRGATSRRFATAVVTAAALTALRLLDDREGASRRDALRAVVDAVAPKHASPVVCFPSPSADAAGEAAATLTEAGLCARAVSAALQGGWPGPAVWAALGVGATRDQLATLRLMAHAGRTAATVAPAE